MSEKVENKKAAIMSGKTRESCPSLATASNKTVEHNKQALPDVNMPYSAPLPPNCLDI